MLILLVPAAFLIWLQYLFNSTQVTAHLLPAKQPTIYIYFS